MNPNALTVMIGGEAGQGLVTLGELLVKCLIRSGYRVVVTQSYLSRIRGGHNTYVIRISPEEIHAPAERVDLLVAFNRETIDLHRDELTDRGVIVADQGLDFDGGQGLKVPFRDLATGRYSNTAALGVAAALLGLDEERAAEAVERSFGKKHPETMEKNRDALAKGYAWTLEHGPDHLRLPPPADTDPRLIMNGNHAIALGAMAGGVRFCSFYPMTPATSVALTLVANADKAGLVVEQAEDEIAAVNMAVGASFAGAPSLVPTSGGGFALMCEGVSLAAITETPLLIVVVQRPGPATGLPTRTEQADLLMVLHAGHGEFPRAIFAPGSVEQCYHLTRHAAALTEKYQSPVFLLSDQFLADSIRAVTPFDVADGPRALPADLHQANLEGIGEPYRRYALTDSGISPRLLPGLSAHLVVADSDEHTEDGHLTEDLDFRVRINDKRLRKMDGLRRDTSARTIRTCCWSVGGRAGVQPWKPPSSGTNRDGPRRCFIFPRSGPWFPNNSWTGSKPPGG
jgi:2-oxoglutarate ferredoxin oxidoreductase subunit alpha